MIGVTRISVDADPEGAAAQFPLCSSKREMHKDAPATAVLAIGVGDAEMSLCIDCARTLFTCVGFMITIVTGEGIEELAGVAKRKRRSK